MKKQVIEKLAALITAGFGLVAALAWNDTIKTVFKRVFGTPDTISAQLIYAIIITVIAVYAAVWVGRASEKAKA